MKIIIIAILSLATCCYAQEKMTVSLNDGSYTTIGGSGRVESLKIEFRQGFDRKPIPVGEKIMALKEKLRFYELAVQHNVDLDKKINAVYTNRPLKDILAELLPNVPVKFDGVDSGVTVDSMTIAKTPLEAVCECLDAAAGVYFHFTDQGITVTAKPVND
jgi:hypothetical protein